ncbi:MAG: DNA repair protein RecO [Ignavibacteriales bacterium]
MSEIVKTEAIVLNKMNYGETSKIATFFTRDYGKLSGIIKGARTPKSSMGIKIDIFNHVQIVVYKKHNSELQLISQAELISYYPRLKENLNKLKYANAVLELVQVLTMEEEAHPKLYRGIIRILSLFESSNQNPGVLLIRFIIFLLKEVGYELQLEQCSICEREIMPGQEKYSFNFERGIVCDSCGEEFSTSFQISQELLENIIGLKNIKDDSRISSGEIERTLNFLEKYLKYHIPEFKGIKSIHLF